MSDNSKRMLAPKRSDGQSTKKVDEVFRPSSTPQDTPRAKTSLSLNKEQYNTLRVYSVTQGVPLRDIFDEAMHLYIDKHINSE